MNIFHVVGPLKVRRSRESGGRMIAEQDIRRFWRDHEKYSDLRGMLHLRAARRWGLHARLRRQSDKAAEAGDIYTG
jgi:hypothetical protein